MDKVIKNIISICWWVWHFLYRCGDSVVTEKGAWNKDYPNYVTPRHICTKCGRKYTRGWIYPLSPWPTVPKMKRPKIPNNG